MKHRVGGNIAVRIHDDEHIAIGLPGALFTATYLENGTMVSSNLSSVSVLTHDDFRSGELSLPVFL